VWLLHSREGEAVRSILTEWDLPAHQPRRSIEGVRDVYLTLQPDDWLFWQNEDRTLVFHDLRTSQTSHPGIPTGRLALLKGHPAASPDGAFLALSHDVGVLTVWESASLIRGPRPRQLSQVGGIAHSFSSCFFTPDGLRLIGGALGAEAIKIWDTRAFHELLTLPGDGTHFHNFSLSTDGRLLGALGSGRIQIWHAPSWEEIRMREKADPHSWIE
jgi:WD40 repeat protein